MQEILVILLFIIALGYLARLAFNTMKGKPGCASNCNCDPKLKKNVSPDPR